MLEASREVAGKAKGQGRERFGGNTSERDEGRRPSNFRL